METFSVSYSCETIIFIILYDAHSHSSLIPFGLHESYNIPKSCYKIELQDSCCSLGHTAIFWYSTTQCQQFREYWLC